MKTYSKKLLYLQIFFLLFVFLSQRVNSAELSYEQNIIELQKMGSQSEMPRIKVLCSYFIGLNSQGKYKDAIKSINESLQQSSSSNISSCHYLQLGYSNYYLEKYEKAIKSFSKIIEQTTNFRNPDLASAYAFTGDSHIAIAGKKEQSLFRKLQTSSIKKHYHRAILNLSKALQLSPSLARVYLNLGAAYSRLGNGAEAISNTIMAKKLLEKLNNNPSSLAQANLNLRNYYQQFGHKPEDFENIKVPSGSSSHISSNQLYKVLDSDSQEIKIYKNLIISNPNSIQNYLHLGFKYATFGRSEDAIKVYRDALKLNPNNAETYRLIGMELHVLGKLSDAIIEYKKVLRINPNDAEAHSSLGSIYKRQGRTQEAVKEYKTALKVDPNHNSSFYGLGLYYSEIGSYQEALSYFKKALKIVPNNPATNLSIGILYSNMGDRDDAIIHLLKAYENYHDEKNPFHQRAKIKINNELKKLHYTYGDKLEEEHINPPSQNQ